MTKPHDEVASGENQHATCRQPNAGWHSHRPHFWDDCAAMTAAYAKRFGEQVPPWELYWYKCSEHYERKVNWYVSALSGLPGDSSVLDIGCGMGELLARCELPADYVGVDVVPEFVVEARHRFPSRSFQCCNALVAALPRADTVVIMGILGSSPEPLSLIERAFALAKINVYFDYFPAYGRDTRGDPIRRLCAGTVMEHIVRAGFEIISETQLGASMALHTRRVSSS